MRHATAIVLLFAAFAVTAPLCATMPGCAAHGCCAPEEAAIVAGSANGCCTPASVCAAPSSGAAATSRGETVRRESREEICIPIFAPAVVASDPHRLERDAAPPPSTRCRLARLATLLI